MKHFQTESLLHGAPIPACHSKQIEIGHKNHLDNAHIALKWLGSEEGRVDFKLS